MPDSKADAIIYNSNIIVIFSNSGKWAIWADRSYEIMILGINFNDVNTYSNTIFEQWLSIEDIDIIKNWVSYSFENKDEINNFTHKLYLNYK